MLVVVNGEELHVPVGTTVAALLQRLEVAPQRVAVEHNRRVVPRSEHPSVRLNHGDHVEIVTFVGGGAS
ncbi:MAG TPA: sulfur carrier protein ThiS [Vicinamibacteria bacterium]|nr:sulfur carrier protein ThiS [Vicinamibacteria bacterium]